MQIVLPPIGVVCVVQNPSKPNSNTNKRDTKYNIVRQSLSKLRSAKPIPQNFIIKIEITLTYLTTQNPVRSKQPPLHDY
jgi:hypothetical protein